jgi:metal-responsive CopG/Arc/MetJ family transcriptional regulator
MADKPRKVSVLLTETEFIQLDDLCHLKGYKKSTLIARLVREFLNENRFQNTDTLTNVYRTKGEH